MDLSVGEWDLYYVVNILSSLLCIFPISFKVGIPNVVSWDGRVSCTSCLVTVAVTFTSDFFSIIIMSGAYLPYYLRSESQIWCMDASLDDDMSRNNFGSL